LLNIELELLSLQRAEELEAAVYTLVERRGQALTIVPTPLFIAHRKRLAEIAITNRLPTMFHRREYVEAGGLMSYGPHFSDMYRRAATYVDKILKGAKPSDLPVEQPSTFELVINLATAKSLGLTISHEFLLLANDLIE
jgi:putative ABC transport system substrate-binding protein